MSIRGLGLDLIDISRAERLLTRKGDRALERLLTPAERASIEGRPSFVQHFASRLAAKEAVYKALQTLPGARGVGWRDIEVVRGSAGRPGVRLHGLASRVAQAAGSYTIHLALSHSDGAAGAVAVLEVAEPGR